MKNTGIFPAIFFTILLFCKLTQPVVIKLENLPETCDYSKCTKPDAQRVNIHLVPHTHDDVGWLKTVDQYFYGTNNGYQKAAVQYIIDSVVEELIRDKERRFIYVETAFFWMWWQEQTDEQRAIVKELVKSGQLEFINGGWSMNDEATCHYNSIIDQMTWGHRRLHDIFGKCGVPKIAWQIDPFGHSREQANLFAAMNFDALFFAREDYQDQKHRRETKTLEHVWQGSDDLGVDGDLFTGMMDMGYVRPQGFIWDILNQTPDDDPIVDNPKSEEYNVPRIVDRFVTLAKNYVKGYATNNIMIPMGMDFEYQDAHVYFKNMDKLIQHVNLRSKDVKIFYSTPSCYAWAVHQANRTWTSKVDDYFPYASNPHDMWSGYYTSRPGIKRFERVGNNILQACKQIDVLAGNEGKFEAQLTMLREIMGVMQHHDAVTGTEKQHVADNYAKHLDTAINECFDVIQKSYKNRLLPKVPVSTSVKNSPPSSVKHEFCPHLNISSCPMTETASNFILNVYNPLGHALKGKQIRFPVDSAKEYVVTGPAGEKVQAALVIIPDYIQKLPGRTSKTNVELVFRVDLPALGLVSYFIQTTTKSTTTLGSSMTKIEKELTLKSKSFDLLFDSTGMLDSVKLRLNGQKINLKAEFRAYTATSSGAYVFRTDNQKAELFAKLSEANLQAEEHSSTQEIHQRFDSFVGQTVRVDPQSDVIEFDWVVGPLPDSSQEIVTRFSTNLLNNRTFYTDANGRQMVKRIWDYRPSWKYEVMEPISGNYYPVTSSIFLRDEKKGIQMTVLNDRAQGGTSPEEGALELMVHRRLMGDDGFGVGEALSERGEDGRGLIVRGKHILILDSIIDSTPKHRNLAQQLLLEPLLSFTTGITEQDYRKQYHTTLTGLTTELPPNIHLLTLEQWTGGQLLLRLEHFYQKDEHPELSRPATLSLRNLFKNFEISEAKELTLSANQDISEVENRLKFNYTPIGLVKTPSTTPIDSTKLEVTLSPMQIRTFLVKIKKD